jgi:glycosyltransferase involved in cell wall biosynthesis
LKLAIVHDWFTTLGGAELVLRDMLRVFPDAHLFALIDKMAPDDRAFIGLGDVTTSFLDGLPGVASRYRSLLPLYPAAVRGFDLSAYDVVISNTHSVAKNARTRDGQLHLSYCHSPMRYAWDLREQYLRESGLDKGARGAMVRTLLDWLQRWDRERSVDVDAFATNSHFLADRIQRAYGRPSTVIHPPVDVEFFAPGEADDSLGEYYTTVSRLVQYKRVDMIARAFSELPDRKLVIVGDGPDAEKVKAACGPNVTMLGLSRRERVRTVLRGAKAFLFAAEEDFGIAPVEAQACGTPVIAYGRGGVLETVIDSGPSRTGVFFREQTPSSLAAAVREFEQLLAPISRDACRKNAERFSAARFRREFQAFVKDEWTQFREGSRARS